MTDLKRGPGAPPCKDAVNDLGYGPMDALHGEFNQLLVRARDCAQGELLQVLRGLDAHLRSHFEAENRWMRDTQFPPRDCHINEHEAVLKSSAEVLALAQAGDFAAAPSFLSELARWFPGHADYLDSALAAWMCKRQFGGKPVVLHRKRPMSDSVTR